MSIRFRSACLLLPVFLLGLNPATADTITLTASDSGSETSFNTGLHWSNNAAPSANNDYLLNWGTLRTPSTAGSFTFAGASLTLTGNAILAYRGGSATSNIITVNNLHLNSGNITSYATGPTAYFTLAGSIKLTGANNNLSTNTGNRGYAVSSVIQGTGSLTFTTNTSTQSAEAITLNATSANTYSGGTTLSNYANVIAASNGAFGTGDVTVNSGLLTLNVGTAIADSASFILSSSLANGAITLSFVGTEIVGRISLDGGASFLSPGTYTASALNTLYGSDVFTGQGQLQVIPEPAAAAWLMSGFAMLAIGARIRASRIRL